MKPAKKKLVEMMRVMILARHLDERAWVLHRQGRVAFHISGIGQEAAQVGAAFALNHGVDWILPYYRDLALMVAFGMTAQDFLLALMGKAGEPSSGGRQMPSHWSDRSMNIISQSSPVATQTPHASGIGLAIKMRGEEGVVFTSIGEGSTSQGEWYEGLNWAAIHKLPVIFFVENNSYAISVPSDKQMAVPSVADKACGLGLHGIQVDGLDPVVVYEEVQAAARRARKGDGPTLIEAMVHRMTPHSSDDDDRSYRTPEEVQMMKETDPLKTFAERLIRESILSKKDVDQMEADAKEEVDAALKFAVDAPYPEAEDGSYPVFIEEVRHG